MKNQLFGREDELKKLAAAYKDKKSRLVVIYGRRRIGKSYLLSTFARNLTSVIVEGVEGEQTPFQIKNFQRELYKNSGDSLLAKAPFTEWSEVLDYLTQFINRQESKIIIVLDELQWMATGQSTLISLLKLYWDNYWKKTDKIMLILCGSIASFMFKQVVHSKALYGRIDLELNIKELTPSDCRKIVGNSFSLDEFFIFYLVLGGVPKYFEVLNKNETFIKNFENLFFSETGYFFNEIEKVFYSQFKEYRTYEKIVQILKLEIKNSEEIGRILKIKSGGGLKRYFDILEKARFIYSYKKFGSSGGNTKYKLFDEYLRFYYKFILPYKKLIKGDQRKNIFQTEVTPVWSSWLGYAFEHFCLKYSNLIAQALGIESEVVDYGPYFTRGDKSFQIDLLFKTKTQIYLCECKYSKNKVSSDIIFDIEKKLMLYTKPQGMELKKVLIAPNGAEKKLEDSDYFYRILTFRDLGL